MRYSKMFGKTVREAKRDMKIASHKLLYQGGFVRELSAGRYTFLPLGMKVWEKIVKLIDEEMEAIGSQEVSIPILQPIEIWKRSNRDKAWGSLLMKINDARGAEFALSATGEGVMTELVGAETPSHKDLPIIIHQFIMKFRDEIRTRGGLIRVREFVMKDAYSFHADEEDFMKTYQDFYKAYSNVCERLKLEYYPVIADSGALGGDYCHEFQIPCEAGEDKIVKCSKCEYAANVEKAKFVRKEINKGEEQKEFKTIDQEWEAARKISDMVKFYDRPEDNMIKSVVYKDSEGRLVIGIVTGDLDVNPVKLASVVGVGELEEAAEEDLASIGAISGNVHAWGYDEFEREVIFVADESIVKATNLLGGFKTETTDTMYAKYGRDFESDFTGDIAEPYDGAKCAECSGELKLIKTIELGHIFKYDHFYSDHHNGFFIDKDGKKKPMFMGAYGIGVGRAIATVVEKHNDDRGIIWPASIAPYDVHLVSLGQSETIVKQAEDLYKNLKEDGFDVLWDDRDKVSAGVKLSDADLIGVPVRVLISDRSLENGGVEVKVRSEAESSIVKLAELSSRINEVITNS